MVPAWRNATACQSRFRYGGSAVSIQLSAGDYVDEAAQGLIARVEKEKFLLKARRLNHQFSKPSQTAGTQRCVPIGQALLLRQLCHAVPVIHNGDQLHRPLMVTLLQYPSELYRELRGFRVRRRWLQFSSSHDRATIHAAYGPIAVGVQGLKPSVDGLTGVGGVGGVAHGILLKSKNSSRFD